MKTCTGCTKTLPVSNFSKRKAGFQPLCKTCVVAYQHSYTGKLIILFNHQKSSSKLRKHPAPNYTKVEFRSWAEACGYALLHATWAASGFEKRLAPSADRLNNHLPYTLENLQLVTWGENHDNAINDFISGKLINRHTPIRQLTLSGEHVATYISQQAASRATGIRQGNISTACRKLDNPVASGYRWELVNE